MPGRGPTSDEKSHDSPPREGHGPIGPGVGCGLESGPTLALRATPPGRGFSGQHAGLPLQLGDRTVYRLGSSTILKFLKSRFVVGSCACRLTVPVVSLASLRAFVPSGRLSV